MLSRKDGLVRSGPSSSTWTWHHAQQTAVSTAAQDTHAASCPCVRGIRPCCLLRFSCTRGHCVICCCMLGRSSKYRAGPVQVTYDLTLARYYMWAQTAEHIFIAVHVPTGADAPMSMRDGRQLQESSAEASCQISDLAMLSAAQPPVFCWAAASRHTLDGMLAGYADKELLLDCNDMGLKLQPECSPPLIHRAFSYGLDMSQPVDTFRCMQ